MKLDKFVTSVGLTIGTVLFVSNSAQAASFTTNFTQENGATGDVFLDSITQNDRTINRFSFVESAEIIQNDEYTGGDTGAASTDRGDDIDDLTTTENLTADNEDEIANFLGNNNLNNIIDTEDDGTFEMNLFFDSVIRADNTGLDSLFFWERGMNSDLQVQAIDDTGNIIGNAIKLLRFKDRDRSNTLRQESAGFQIDTTEIDGAQKVGSWGVSLEQLGVSRLSGIRVYANEDFNGPDFKVIARRSGTDFARASVPEPGTIIGLGSVAALAFVRRRKSK